MERKVTQNQLSLQVQQSYYSVGFRGGAEAERYCRLCLVHSRSSLDLRPGHT